jgi:hypothetical protein
MTHLYTVCDKNELYLFVKGQHKIEFIPEIVGPILEMTLIPETGLLFLSIIYVDNVFGLKCFYKFSASYLSSAIIKIYDNGRQFHSEYRFDNKRSW